MKGAMERKINSFSNKIEGKIVTIEKNLEESNQNTTDVIKSSGTWKLPFFILLVGLIAAAAFAYKKFYKFFYNSKGYLD